MKRYLALFFYAAIGIGCSDGKSEDSEQNMTTNQADASGFFLTADEVGSLASLNLPAQAQAEIEQVIARAKDAGVEPNMKAPPLNQGALDALFAKVGTHLSEETRTLITSNMNKAKENHEDAQGRRETAGKPANPGEASSQNAPNVPAG